MVCPPMPHHAPRKGDPKQKRAEDKYYPNFVLVAGISAVTGRIDSCIGKLFAVAQTTLSFSAIIDCTLLRQTLAEHNDKVASAL